MGELGLNKILFVLLATALVIMGLRTLSDAVFSHGHGHGYHGEEELSYNEMLAKRYAYYVEVDGGGAGAEEPEEEAFDLAAALASADAGAGERAFKAKCATCHTVEQGGANGTGPNLYNVVGADKASHDGFTYSRALSELDGEWTYGAMNEWLLNPAGYARGTSMAFAGLRRDDERANTIAYLKSISPDAPPLPEPAAADTDEAALDTGAGPDGAEIVPAAGETVTDEAAEAIELLTGEAVETGEAGEN